MVRRIFLVALFTGSAQLISLATISYVIRNLGEQFSGFMGIIDSTVLIIAAVASFGIQLSVNRNVAIQKHWGSNYHLAQSARLSVSLLVIVFAFGSYLLNWDQTKLIYFAAPLIALNGDYALYGNGLPVQAARLSFFRVAIPNIGLIVVSKFWGGNLLYIYIVLIAVGIFISGFFASRINKVPYMFFPLKNFHKVYIKYYKVGLFQLSAALMLTGILTITKGFYSIATIGFVYGILKYFEVFKGVLRIIVQAFFKELKLENVNLRIDKVGMIIGCFTLIPTLIFTKTTLSIIYGNKYLGLETLLILFGVAMTIASFTTSAGTKALLLKRDNLNLIAYLSSMTLSILTALTISFTQMAIYGIPIGILAGEVLLLLILGYNLGGLNYFMERINFFIKLIPFVVFAILLKLIIGESSIILLIACIIYILSVLYLFRKLIFDTSFLIRKTREKES